METIIQPYRRNAYQYLFLFKFILLSNQILNGCNSIYVSPSSRDGNSSFPTKFPFYPIRGFPKIIKDDVTPTDKFKDILVFSFTLNSVVKFLVWYTPVYEGIHARISWVRIQIIDKIVIVVKSAIALIMQHDTRPYIVNTHLCIVSRKQNRNATKPNFSYISHIATP